jgi:hypothetical protein
MQKDGEAAMKCGTCRYWDELNKTLGSCHRYAPRPVIKETTESRTSCAVLWPKTKEGEWCGEWSVKVELEPQQ